jgi:hypothetical protein
MNAELSNTNRRSFLALAMAASTASGQRVLARSSVTPSLAQDLATYVGFGEHRVGTAGEHRTARWLNGRMQQLGFNSRIEPFVVPTLLNPAGLLRAGDERIAAFPQWMPPHSVLGKTLSAPLQLQGAEAGPASLRYLADPVGFTAGWTPALDKMANDAAKGALALILAINISSGDLFVCNQHDAKPLPLPVALIAKRDLPRLNAKDAGVASLRLSGRPVKANSLNVVANKPGVGQNIVVSTPLTGWFSCGGERGPGIALWLRMAKLLAQSPRPVLMLGTGSHEIGHHGIGHHLSHHALAPDDVALWLHFGASLAATQLDKGAGFNSPQYLVGLADTEARAREAFGKRIPIYVPGSPRTQGEAGPIIAGGYRNFIGMSGMFPAFHTPADRGDAVDFEGLEAIALSAEALITAFS